MRNRLYYILLLLCLPHSILAQQINPNSATVTFEFVSKNVEGTIAGFKSDSKIDFDNPETSVFEGSVAVKTLNTNNGLRNWHLKGSKYFDEDDYPRIYFKSTSVSKKQDAFIVKGNLTLKGITKPITIDFVKTGSQLEGTTAIYSSDYGIQIKKKREDNLVTINLLLSVH